MAAQFGFGGHESFPMRYGWLKKGYDLIARSPTGLTQDSAMTTLGVGKNMVGAIRHWGEACKVFEAPHANRGVVPTLLGAKLLADGGWDPYLEDCGSTWLLHWNLVNNKADASAWWWVFSRPRGNRFTKETLLAEIQQQVHQHDARCSEATVQRDIEVLVRSYLRRSRSESKVAEELLESPFSTLGLLRNSATSGEFELVQGIHPTLPLAVFEYALLEHCVRGDLERKAVSLDELMYGELSPGRVFRLSEDGLMSRLHALQERKPANYVVDETAGLRQLLIHGDLADKLTVLDDHLGKAGRLREATWAPA